MRCYFKKDQSVRDEISVRLFFLRQLLESWRSTENTATKPQPLRHKTTTAVGDSLQPSSFLEPTVATMQGKHPGILATCNLPLLQSDNGRKSEDTGQAVESPLHQMTSALQPIVSTKQSSQVKRGDEQCFMQSTAYFDSLVCKKDIDLISLSNESKIDRRINIERPFSKRVASEHASSSCSPEEEDDGIALAGPLPKRKDKHAPSPRILAKQLLGPGGAERLKRHILTFARSAPAFPEAFDEHGDRTKQICEILNLAKDWEEKSAFSKLVGLILRTHGVELINAEARSMLKLDEKAPDPLVPKAIIDRISPHLPSQRTPASLRSWLTQTRRLLMIKDFLPFMPFGSSGLATFRNYERSTNKEIEQLCNILKKDPRAQQMAKVGRAFRDCVLQRRAYLWASFSPEELSKLSQDTLFHLVTITGGTCDVCKANKCNLIPVCQALASKQPSFPRPQLQLVLPRKISDTAESIQFCVKGDIGGLQRLFSLGLASPRDESHSRGFSLLRVSYNHALLHQKP